MAHTQHLTIGTLEQATNDRIRRWRFRPLLQRYVQFGCVMVCVTTLHTCMPTVVCKDVGNQWSVGVDAEFRYLGVAGRRKVKARCPGCQKKI